MRTGERGTQLLVCLVFGSVFASAAEVRQLTERAS